MRVFALQDVTGNRLVKRQVGEAVLVVQSVDLQVDPELARNLAVDRSRAAVRRRRARFLFRRQPLHFHVRIDERVERARQLRANPRQALLDERHDFLARPCRLRELVSAILGERLHALADRAGREADALQDGVHLGMQLLSSRWPIACTSSGVMLVVVDALSAQR